MAYCCTVAREFKTTMPRIHDFARKRLIVVYRPTQYSLNNLLLTSLLNHGAKELS